MRTPINNITILRLKIKNFCWIKKSNKFYEPESSCRFCLPNWASHRRVDPRSCRCRWAPSVWSYRYVYPCEKREGRSFPAIPATLCYGARCDNPRTTFCETVWLHPSSASTSANKLVCNAILLSCVNLLKFMILFLLHINTLTRLYIK